MDSKNVTQSLDFRKMLVQIAGKNGFQVAEVLMDKENVTDEEIARETGISLNLVRKILYDFYDNSLASYRRTHDSDSGWYTYHWQIEPDKALELIEEKKSELLQKLEERLEYERETMFFSCGNNCPRVDFDTAMTNSFRCPQCGEELREFDNVNIISALENQIESLKHDITGS